MNGTQMLLLGLVLGAAIGVVATWMVLHDRVRTLREAQRAASEATGKLLRLPDERHKREVARRDAAEEEREAELHRTLAPITATLSHLERSLARSEAARPEAEGPLRSQIRQLAQRAEALAPGTRALPAALRAPASRGRAGAVQPRSTAGA